MQANGVLSDYFTLESHVASTRSADAYIALHKERGVNVCLWMLRHPLAPKSDAVPRFLSRIESIQGLQSPLCQILEYGVDSSGMAYAVLPALDGQPLAASARDSTEIERRFICCLRLVEKLHNIGVVCGDLSAASFWSDRSGDIWFTGVMGSFDTEAAATAVMPPAETLHFLSPEQRSGGTPEPASDVFALGVLGYYLFANHYPYGDSASLFATDLRLENVLPLSSWIPMPPVWADGVLRRCLNSAPDKRYANAGAILQGISEVRQRGYSELPVKTKRDVILRKPTGLTGKNSLVDVAKTEAQEEEKPGSDLLRPGLLVAAVLVFALCLGIAWRVMSARSATIQAPSPGNTASATQQAEALGFAGRFGDGQSALSQKAAWLESLVQSDDPLAYDVLVKSAVEANVPELRGLSERAVVERAKRMGLQRSAEQAKLWLRTVPTGDLPPSYEPLLRSLNVNLPIQAREAVLREAYATNPKVALRFAAALALDSIKPEDYRTIVSQLVGDSLQLPGAGKYSVLGLILAHPELALVFGEDVVQRKAEIPDADLEWLLKILADRNDLNVRAFANLAVEKKVLSPIRRMFLATVSEREDLPGDILNALVRAAAGALSSEDLAGFGRWYDVQSEKLLLALCADAGDSQILAQAFDILAGKSLITAPSAGLVEWVRHNAWSKRLEFAPIIGMLAHLDLLPMARVEEAIKVLDPYMKDARLSSLMLEANNPTVTRLIIERYGAVFSGGTLLNLLSNSDPNARIMAIRALRGYNDVAALKVVIDSYAREKDPEVQKVYRETFWVLAKRD